MLHQITWAKLPVPVFTWTACLWLVPDCCRFWAKPHTSSTWCSSPNRALNTITATNTGYLCCPFLSQPSDGGCLCGNCTPLQIMCSVTKLMCNWKICGSDSYSLMACNFFLNKLYLCKQIILELPGPFFATTPAFIMICFSNNVG